jgi:hypothetical protein
MNIVRALFFWLRDWWHGRRRQKRHLRVVRSIFETISEAERRPS